MKRKTQTQNHLKKRENKSHIISHGDTVLVSPMKSNKSNNADFLKPFLKPNRFGCPFCKSPGQYQKVYGNLWKLKIHFQRDHNYDSDCDDVIIALLFAIKRRILL